MKRQSEFITRTITAGAIALVTLTCIAGPGWSFAILLGAIALQGSIELFRLLARIESFGRLNFVPLVLGVAICLALFVIGRQREMPWLLPVTGSVMILFIAILLTRPGHPEQIVARGRTWLLTGLYPLLLLTAGLSFLWPVYEYGYVLLAVILIWINDVMAYLVGRQWGQRKIVPALSPGKSLEGTLGAALFTVIASLFVTNWFPSMPRSYALALGILTPFLSLAGDLWESAIKRVAGVKDSGSLMPGHGGVLDRFDSFLFVLPVAALLKIIFAG